MRVRQVTFMCIVSGFIGAFIAIACGATDGGKDVYADDDIVDDGDGDITPIDDVILTKRIVEVSLEEYISNPSAIYDYIDGDEVFSLIMMKNGQPNADTYDTIRWVIIE